MYIPHACIVLTIAFYATSHPAPTLASQNQNISKRSAQQPGNNLALPAQTTNSSLANIDVPREIECYTQEPGRPFITYDSCLLLFTRVSSHRMFRNAQEYSPGYAKTPWIWRSGRDCEIQVWAGRVSEASDQYIMAMAAWILQQCQPRYEVGAGYGGQAAFAQDLLIRVSYLPGLVVKEVSKQ